MDMLNERQQIRDVAKRWRRQYPSGLNSGGVNIGAKLDELDVETATADDVARVIGNRSWVRPNICDECKTETWDAVQLGEDPGYESNTATICANCLRAALRLLGAA